MELLARCLRRQRRGAPDQRRWHGQRRHRAPLSGAVWKLTGARSTAGSAMPACMCREGDGRTVHHAIEDVLIVKKTCCDCEQGTLGPGTLLACNLLGAAALLAAVTASSPKLEPKAVGRALRRAVLLLAGTYLLSPLLRVSERVMQSPPRRHNV